MICYNPYVGVTMLGIRSWQDAAAAVAVAATLVGAMGTVVWFIMDAQLAPLRAEHREIRADISQLRDRLDRLEDRNERLDGRLDTLETTARVLEVRVTNLEGDR